MLGNCHLFVVKPRSEKGAEFHECVSSCQRCVPGLPPALPGLRNPQSQGNFWDVHWASPRLLCWKLPGPVYMDIVYKLHRETAPHSSFRLHPFPPQQLSPLSVQMHPEHPASSRQQMWIQNTNKAGQECLCDNFWKDNAVPAK